MISIFIKSFFQLFLLTTPKKKKKKNIMIANFLAKHFLNDKENENFKIE